MAETYVGVRQPALDTTIGIDANRARSLRLHGRSRTTCSPIRGAGVSSLSILAK